MMAEPMYKQIADDLRKRIETKDLSPGRRLPTEIELMEEFNASRNTVRDAIKQLTTRRLVETRPGQGTFVLEMITPVFSTLTGDPNARTAGESPVYIAEVRAEGREPTVSEPRVEIQALTNVLADALLVPVGTEAVSRHQQRYVDGTPWSLQTSFYPMSLVERGASRLIQAREIPQGVMAYLADELGIKQVGYRDSIAARPPDETEASFFRLQPDGRVQVFEIFRVGFDENGDRLRLTVTVLPADRNRLLVSVGQVP
jgi:GntR family transcriptional regulator